jgi:hypothetical protein
LSSPTRFHLLSGLWLRLYIHALLRGSRIFPNLELCDKSSEYTPAGFADIWKGSYDGELVCVKAIRTQHPIRLRKIERVCSSFIESETYLARFIPDIAPCNKGEQAQSPPERAPHHWGFGDSVSVLHHESVDARWEHYPVHPNKHGCRSVDAGACP